VPSQWDAEALFRFVDVMGVVANGLLGGAVARSKRFDIVGFATLAIISGLGGGMIRDVLLGAGYPVALVDPAYLSGALIAAFVAYLINLEGTWPRRTLALADVLALGCWSATGTIKAASLGLQPVSSIMLGVITAVGGGMLRDVLVGRTPAVFGGNTLYASLAVVGSIEALALFHLGMADVGMGVSIVTCAVLGLLARRLGWMLPEPIDFNLRSALKPLDPRANVLRLKERNDRRANRNREASAADADADQSGS
jgi:uncharacterized membrane protein YeiH